MEIEIGNATADRLRRYWRSESKSRAALSA
jgi:hypothetical protein